MHPFRDPRAQVAAQLTALSAPGAPLHRDSDHSTARLYRRGDLGRARFQRDTIAWYLSQANPRLGGRTAIVTAGPPGAGKSALLRARIADLDEYRIIDADIVKDRSRGLTERSPRSSCGLFSRWCRRTSPKGRRCRSRKQRQSATTLADSVEYRCR